MLMTQNDCECWTSCTSVPWRIAHSDNRFPNGKYDSAAMTGPGNSLYSKRHCFALWVYSWPVC